MDLLRQVFQLFEHKRYPPCVHTPNIRLDTSSESCDKDDALNITGRHKFDDMGSPVVFANPETERIVMEMMGIPAQKAKPYAGLSLNKADTTSPLPDITIPTLKDAPKMDFPEINALAKKYPIEGSPLPDMSMPRVDVNQFDFPEIAAIAQKTDKAYSAKSEASDPVRADTQPVRADTQPVRADTQPARADTQPARADTQPALDETSDEKKGGKSKLMNALPSIQFDTDFPSTTAVQNGGGSDTGDLMSERPVSIQWNNSDSAYQEYDTDSIKL